MSAEMTDVRLPAKDFRLTFKVRNNRLLKAIESSGKSPGYKWCEENGLNYAKVSDLISLRSSPLKADGGLSLHAIQLCEVLGRLPEELWSEEHLYPTGISVSEVELDFSQIAAMMPTSEQSYLLDSVLDDADLKKVLSTAISTLPETCRKVLYLRFYKEFTLGQCAQAMSVTPERVRQIEKNGFRLLRQPERQGIYVDALDGISSAQRVMLKAETKRAIAERRIKISESIDGR